MLIRKIIGYYILKFSHRDSQRKKWSIEEKIILYDISSFSEKAWKMSIFKMLFDIPTWGIVSFY